MKWVMIAYCEVSKMEKCNERSATHPLLPHEDDRPLCPSLKERVGNVETINPRRVNRSRASLRVSIAPVIVVSCFRPCVSYSSLGDLFPEPLDNLLCRDSDVW